MSRLLNIIQVVGARPQIIKSAAIERAVNSKFSENISLKTVHTGQHYSDGMSDVFYRELGISIPDIDLEVGSGSHAQQTSAMIKSCEKVFREAAPDGVIVYGDTNSTLAGALTAYKLNIPVFHVEAGLRSHDLKMPEETNRICTDHFSTLLFCPTLEAMNELEQEGLTPNPGPYSVKDPGVFHTGDIMFDNILHYAEEESKPIKAEGFDMGSSYILTTLHRPQNTDDPNLFKDIIEALANISEDHSPVIFPMHPRLSRHESILKSVASKSNFHLIPAVSYLQIISLIKHCSAVITDSGGLQKEAFFLKKPCLVLRNETEWKELVENGNASLCTEGPDHMKTDLERLLRNEMSYPQFYGDGHSAEKICQHIIQYYKTC